MYFGISRKLDNIRPLLSCLGILFHQGNPKDWIPARTVPENILRIRYTKSHQSQKKEVPANK